MKKQRPEACCGTCKKSGYCWSKEKETKGITCKEYEWSLSRGHYRRHPKNPNAAAPMLNKLFAWSKIDERLGL